MNNKIKTLRKEFEKIKNSNGGFVTPELVVKHAEKKTSLLHGYFTWDNTEAARLYRIQEAQSLIRRIYIRVEDPKNSKNITNIRAYVSLTNDRRKNGYRDVIDVLSDEQLRLQMIDDMENDLEAFRKKLVVVSRAADKYAGKIAEQLRRERVFIKNRKPVSVTA